MPRPSLTPQTFHSLYAQGMVRVAVATPLMHLTEPEANAAITLHLAQQAHEAGVGLVLFPELGLSGYSIDDLLHQAALLEAVETAIGTLLEASASLRPVLLVGAPLRQHGRLYNCAVAIHRGQILGVVPKSYLPNYREFYEARYFTPGTAGGAAPSMMLCGKMCLLGQTCSSRPRIYRISPLASRFARMCGHPSLPRPALPWRGQL